MKFLFLVIGVCWYSQSFSQVEDAWVYFTDKSNTQEFLDNPVTMLTQKAIDRKEKHSVPIDERDVPINENYIISIKNSQGITYLAKSKWFNCVYVRGSVTDLRNLENFEFVERIDFADNSLDMPSTRRNIPVLKRSGDKDKFVLETKMDFDYGAATAQTEQLKVDVLHRQGYTGQGMTIAVMDSGFPNVGTNPAFEKARAEGRLLEGYDFVNRSEDELRGNSHGAHTFSNIAGYLEGEFVGTAPDASYHLFVTEDTATEGPKEEALWVEAAERADSLGVDVINTSLGYLNLSDNPAYNYAPSDMDGKTAFISRGANIAFEKGMLVVVSAGNSGNDPWEIVSAPADAPGAFSIGAITANGSYASFSSKGPTADNRVKPDVVARGSATAIVRSDGSVATSSGTSFSGPIIAGAMASLWQAIPEKTNTEIMQLVRESASQFTTPDTELGYGIPDFSTILQTLNLIENRVETLAIFPNPVKDILSVMTPVGEQAKASIYAFDGKLVKKVSFQNNGNIYLSELASGLYLLQIEGKNRSYRSKFIKY